MQKVKNINWTYQAYQAANLGWKVFSFVFLFNVVLNALGYHASGDGGWSGDGSGDAGWSGDGGSYGNDPIKWN